MSQPKTTSVAAEGGHWYHGETGEQIVEVPRAKGDGMRKPTLRDARKAGNWYPGCTSVIRAAGMPAGLMRWQQEQAIEAALKLDAQPEEDRSAYMRRVIGKAGEIAAEAATVGTDIHRAIELYMRGQPYDQFYHEHVMAAVDALDVACPTATTLHPWLSEQSCVHSSGFGCRVDLHSEIMVADIKTKKGTLEDWAGRSGRLTTFPEHWMQLAACRAALVERFGWEPKQQGAGIVYVSRDHAGVAEFVPVTEEQLDQGWAMFGGLLAFWKASNRYDPTEWRA